MNFDRKLRLKLLMRVAWEIVLSFIAHSGMLCNWDSRQSIMEDWLEYARVDKRQPFNNAVNSKSQFTFSSLCKRAVVIFLNLPKRYCKLAIDNISSNTKSSSFELPLMPIVLYASKSILMSQVSSNS